MKRVTRSFLRGMGSVLELIPAGGRTRVGRSIEFNRTDAEALARDWHRAAGDFRVSFHRTIDEARQQVRSKQTR